MLELPTRRGLLVGLGAFLVAAPAIVRASSIMPVSARHLAALTEIDPIIQQWTFAYQYIMEKDADGLEQFVVKRISAEEMLKTA